MDVVSNTVLAANIRSGRKLVAGQIRGTHFQWDARRPKWRCDRYPPNMACALGMALLAEGYAGPWDAQSAQAVAVSRWGADTASWVARMNDELGWRWDKIADALDVGLTA